MFVSGSRAAFYKHGAGNVFCYSEGQKGISIFRFCFDFMLNALGITLPFSTKEVRKTVEPIRGSTEAKKAKAAGGTRIISLV